MGSVNVGPNEIQSIEYDQDSIRQPPRSFLGRLAYLGPGIIIAGSIVGAGELIATTSTGAVAGFSLLWLIILGCIIKVFVQVELGKHAVLTGKGTMQALGEMPGPKIGKVNWALTAWFIMFIAGILALGAVLSGIGQAMALAMPISNAGLQANIRKDHQTQLMLLSQEIFNDALQQVSIDPPSSDYQLDSGLQKQWFDQVDKLWVRDELNHAPAKNLMWITMANRLKDQQLKPLLENQDSLSTQQLEHRSKLETLAADLENQRQFFLNDEQRVQEDFERLLAAIEAEPASHSDALIWAIGIGVFSLALLISGRFRVLEIICLVLVGLFTVATFANLFLLQSTEWRISGQQLLSGLQFRLPVDQGLGNFSPISTALMTFGIIGVGAAELLAYPYWCLEKGYARFTGPKESSDDWANRASGWLSILRMDAWLSMLVYTFSTIVFYLLGAAVLHSLRIAPANDEMVRSLALMFEPTMGPTGKVIFLCGSVAVLYSTFLVATASHSKTAADAFRVAGFLSNDRQTLKRAYQWICSIVTVLVLILVWMNLDPASVVLVGGFFQALMLPVLASTAIYFRYRRERIAKLENGLLWDTFLWLSSAGMFICGAWLFYLQLAKVLG